MLQSAEAKVSVAPRLRSQGPLAPSSSFHAGVEAPETLGSFTIQVSFAKTHNTPRLEVLKSSMPYYKDIEDGQVSSFIVTGRSRYFHMLSLETTFLLD